MNKYRLTIVNSTSLEDTYILKVVWNKYQYTRTYLVDILVIDVFAMVFWWYNIKDYILVLYPSLLSRVFSLFTAAEKGGSKGVGFIAASLDLFRRSNCA